MRKNLTEIVFILDRSGSMCGLEKDTIGGFNSFINKQKKNEGEAYVSTVLFDHERIVLHDRVDIREIHDMTERDYSVRGMTALLDAIGSSIHHIANIHKYAREEDVPEKTIFLIITDGYENASKEYTYRKVKEMIENEKEKHGWEFIFMGANIDAVGEASKFGIEADRSVTFKNDSRGQQLNYEVLDEAVTCMRASRPLAASWKKRIEDDVKRRK